MLARTVPASTGDSAITGYDYRLSSDSGNWGDWSPIQNNASPTKYRRHGASPS